MKLENVLYNNEKCNITFSRYSNSDFLAVLINFEDEEYGSPITTNNSSYVKSDFLDENGNNPEYIQIRSDEPQYVEFLIENGLIQEDPAFSIPQGFISIFFFEPTDEFAQYIKENIEE